MAPLIRRPLAQTPPVFRGGARLTTKPGAVQPSKALASRLRRIPPPATARRSLRRL